MRASLGLLLFASALLLTSWAAPAEPSLQAAAKSGQQKTPLLKDKYGDPLPKGALARLGTLRLRTGASDMVVSADGKNLITAAGGTVCRLDAATGLVLDTKHLSATPATSSRLSPDGKTLAVPEGNGLALYDIASSKRLHILPVKGLSWAFGPDGKTLIAPSDAQKDPSCIRLWDIATGKQRAVVELSEFAWNVAVTHDGKRLLASLDSSTLACFDVATGEELWQDDTAWPGNIAVSPDGKTICTDHHLGRGPLKLWNAETGKALGILGTESPTHFLFSPDSKLLAAGTPDETVIWDVTKQQVAHRFATGGLRVAFSPDGRSLFTLGDLLLRWDVTTGKQIYKHTSTEGHTGSVEAVTFAPDGKSLASWGRDGTVRHWTFRDGKHRILRSDAPEYRLGYYDLGGGYQVTISSIPLLFTSDGRRLLTADKEYNLVLTDVQAGKENRRFVLPHFKMPKNAPGFANDPIFIPTVNATGFSEDGRTLFVLGGLPDLGSTFLPKTNPPTPKPLLWAWDVSTGKNLWTRNVLDHVFSAGFTPNGRLLLDAAFNLHDMRTGGQRQLAETPLHAYPVTAFSADSRLMAVQWLKTIADIDLEVRIIDLTTGKHIAQIGEPLGRGLPMALSPDGRMLAAIGPDALHVWQVSTGKRLLHIPGNDQAIVRGGMQFASCMTFSPDGKSLATGHANGTILLWDMTPAWNALTVPKGPVDTVACWAALADADPKNAYSAIDLLAANPSKALPLLREKLTAVAKVDPKWLAARLADLDSTKFS
ncbi:MAG TPA: WD40 repeat domain-containing protein, partial [Gemmataceae bacterium]|nr:WD40 repeat domain-containing protein [Gemmataceae bacterium]